MKASAIGLSTASRSAIVSAFVAALNTAENTGGLVHTVCEIVARATKGTALSVTDSKAIVVDIASAKGWKGDSAASRMSEVRVILKASDKLPEAIELFRKRNKGCTWHNSMALARSLNGGKSISQAVTAAVKGKSAGEGNPVGRLAGCFVACVPKLKGDKRDALINAARKLVAAGVIEFTGKNATKFANA